jgi:hypothetical protein
MSLFRTGIPDNRSVFERFPALSPEALAEITAYGRRLARNARQREEERRRNGMTARLRTEIQADRDDAVECREPWIKC